MAFFRSICIGFLGLIVTSCSSLFDNRLELSYTVRVADIDSQIFEVELFVREAEAGTFKARIYTYKEYTPIEAFKAVSQDGIALQVEQEEQYYRKGDFEYTHIIKKIHNPDGGNFRLIYRVRVGTNYAPHGLSPYQTHGYVSEHSGLVSGRNIFLLPDQAAIASIRVKFDFPKEWQVAVPWDKHDGWYIPQGEGDYLKSELVNTSISMGHLDQVSKRVGNTDVSVYVFKGWESSVKDSISQRAFSIYQAVANLFGEDAGGKYVFNFVPKTHDDLLIFADSWSSSQGSEMYPLTAERWLQVTEKLIKRWIVYPPTHMVYDSQEDFWILDGIKRYYAIKIGEEMGWLNGSQYLASQARKFTNNVAFQRTQNPIFAPKDIQLSRKMDVRTLYVDDSERLLKRRNQIVPTVVGYLDAELMRQSGGKQTFADVMKYQYAKRTGLNLRADIEAIAGAQIVEQVFDNLYDIRKVAAKEGLIEPVPKIPSLKRQVVGLQDTLKILLTGLTRGFIEHCGCKVNQSGGVARRATVIQRLRQQDPNLLLIDSGNAFTQIDNQYHLKPFDIEELGLYLATMDQMQYNLGTVGFSELLYGESFFQHHTSSINFPFLCANIRKNGELIAKPHISIKSGKYKIGFLGIYEWGQGDLRDVKQNFFQDRTFDLTFLDPVETIKRYLPQLRRENDIVAIVGSVSPKLIQKEISNIKGVDLVISISDGISRLSEMDGKMTFIGRTLPGFVNGIMVIYPTISLYGIEITDIVIDEESKKIVAAHIKPVFLDDTVSDDATVRSMVDAHYSTATSVDVEPLMAWDERFSMSDYVGAETCQACHQAQHEQWRLTAHATAINTLLDVRRQYQPKCVVCHVTGAGYKTGYKMGDLQHPLINVQCEMCHGPGGAHVKNPGNVDMLHKPSEKLCATCHDEEHSDFDFASYYPKVKH